MPQRIGPRKQLFVCVFFIPSSFIVLMFIRCDVKIKNTENIFKNVREPLGYQFKEYNVEVKRIKRRKTLHECLEIPNVSSPVTNATGSDSVWFDKCSDRIPQQMDWKLVKHNLTTREKVIWVKDYPNVPEGVAIFRKMKCPVLNCKITRSITDKADLRIFPQEVTFLDILNYQAQIVRSREEIWVMSILESPLASPDYIFIDGVFNWTATYRRDSTVAIPYAKWIRNKERTGISKPINYAEGKTKQVAMFVSNCKTSNHRLGYAMNLSQYIDVDIYGLCGNKTCEKDNYKTCFKMLEKDYKFYLSFENANCRDYITEKLFTNALQHNVIPVVMGAHPLDYKAMAPPGSYIHVEDFPSPRHLARYLHRLDNDDEFYNRYFMWKGQGKFIETKFWCRLCALLNKPDKPQITTGNLNLWWRPPGICINENERWT